VYLDGHPVTILFALNLSSETQFYKHRFV